MADVKLTGMTELDAAPALTDIVYLVDDPSGTPLSRKMTVANLLAAIDRHKSLTPVLDAAGDFASEFTGADLYGGTFVCNVTGTIALPAVAVGMNFTIITLEAIEVVVDPNGTEHIWLDGADAGAGTTVTNNSTAGDIIVLQYYSSGNWIATSNGWT